MFSEDLKNSLSFLFDSTIYINAFRTDGQAPLIFQRWERESPLWLSSVVLEELWAGADKDASRALAKLEHDFELAGRILTPNHGDWTRAGKLLAKVGKRFGYEEIGRARLVNDALIATSAARCGISVVTANRRDFARLAEFCPVQWETPSVTGDRGPGRQGN
jgi:predicted nucleic acid-binding protein